LDQDEDADYFIQGNVVDTNVTSNRNDKNMNVNDNVWEENAKVFEYEETKPKAEEPKKKIGWGDNIATTKTVAVNIKAEDFYFPGLDDKDAKKNAPKQKQVSSIKNAALFGENSNQGGSNWEKPLNIPAKANKFDAEDAPIRFTNSKGNSEKLNKFMTKEGPVYDEGLGENVEERMAVQNEDLPAAPLKFQGKIKIGSEVSEADLQREKFLKECQERAKNDDIEKERVKESRFTNSKGGFKNNGLMMTGDQSCAGVTNAFNEERKTFTNTKKPKLIVEPVLDPTIPTVTKQNAVEAKVSVATWD